MDIKLALSLLITFFSLGTVLIGIPAQIVKNYKEKRSGQPLLTLILLIGLYASQIGFFIITESYIPLISFIAGFIMWSIVLVQYFLYKSK